MPSALRNIYDSQSRNHPNLIIYAPGNVFKQLSTDWEVVLENDGSTGVIIIPQDGIIICNNTNANRWFSLAILDNNDVVATDSPNKRLYYETPLELASSPGTKGETYELPRCFHLHPGERLVMQASANSSVNVMVNYLQMQ